MLFLLCVPFMFLRLILFRFFLFRLYKELLWLHPLGLHFRCSDREFFLRFRLGHTNGVLRLRDVYRLLRLRCGSLRHRKCTHSSIRFRCRNGRCSRRLRCCTGQNHCSRLLHIFGRKRHFREFVTADFTKALVIKFCLRTTFSTKFHNVFSSSVSGAHGHSWILLRMSLPQYSPP